MAVGLVIGSSSSFVGESFIGSDDTAPGGGWANISKINGITATSFSKVNGVAVASISKVNGVAV